LVIIYNHNYIVTILLLPIMF